MAVMPSYVDYELDGRTIRMKISTQHPGSLPAGHYDAVMATTTFADGSIVTDEEFARADWTISPKTETGENMYDESKSLTGRIDFLMRRLEAARSEQERLGAFAPRDTKTRIRVLERQLDEAIEEAEKFQALFERFKDVPQEDGTIVAFTRQFHSGGTEYSYAAVCGGGNWFVTGRTQHGFKISFRELCEDFLADAKYVAVVTELTEW